MTPRYPGAVWLPTGDNGPMPNGPDAGSLHIAVTRAPSVFGWVQSEKSCHGFNGQRGYFEQYMDFDRIAEGVRDGNSHVLTIESFDGLLIHNNPYWEEGYGGIYGTDANSGRWDDGQLERIADLIAWCGVELGIPVTQSFRAGNPGWGPHRLGVEPWRTNDFGGGESWTHHDGKPCPGDLRIQQIPGIIARAQVIKAAVQAGRCSWLPTGDVDVPAALARTGGSTPVKPVSTTPAFPWPPVTPPAVEDDMYGDDDRARDAQALKALTDIGTHLASNLATINSQLVALGGNPVPTTAVLFKAINGGIGVADLVAGTWRGVGSPAQLAALRNVPRYQGLAARLPADQVKALFGKQVG